MGVGGEWGGVVKGGGRGWVGVEDGTGFGGGGAWPLSGCMRR